VDPKSIVSTNLYELAIGLFHFQLDGRLDGALEGFDEGSNSESLMAIGLLHSRERYLDRVSATCPGICDGNHSRMLARQRNRLARWFLARST
jgi:hypothetical protein